MDVSAGIPKRIVTDKVLEDFLLAGMLGMADTDNTRHIKLMLF
jgi:hypothetical protein